MTSSQTATPTLARAWRALAKHARRILKMSYYIGLTIRYHFLKQVDDGGGNARCYALSRAIAPRVLYHLILIHLCLNALRPQQ